MTDKIGRNDPCPCGSGKKYKHCCANAGTSPAEAKGHDGAVERAVAWLTAKHRNAVDAAIEEMLSEGLSEDERENLEFLDDETDYGIRLNATEWLLAEGSILVRGEPRRVSELLLAKGGPLFTVDQRRWISQLAEQPLRPYDVTDVVPGKQMTMCDALDREAPPLVVRERSGSQASLVGTQAGFRIMEVDGHWELSGAAYPFSRLAGPGVAAEMREAVDRAGARQRQELQGVLSAIIRRAWLRQYVAPVAMPTMMDAYSGEPMLLITDHYRVVDWEGLGRALRAQSDVQGGRESGWSRLIDCKDGQTRSSVAINPGERGDRISLFYRTQGYADRERPWFEALAGDTVRYLSREISDPKGVMANPPARKQGRPGAAGSDLPPELVADAIEGVIRRTYANWSNEPIPALDGKTPRAAISTPAGLERVKGLLRGYEQLEMEQAQQQGRHAISYSFLWEALGIER